MSTRVLFNGKKNSCCVVLAALNKTTTGQLNSRLTTFLRYSCSNLNWCVASSSLGFRV